VITAEQERSCTRKILYYGIRRALEAAEEHNVKKNDNVRPYVCRFGRHFHLGHWKEDKAQSAKGRRNPPQG
jgi:hypothetical protein